MPDPGNLLFLAAALVAAGLAAGLIAGLLGVGGGIVIAAVVAVGIAERERAGTGLHQQRIRVAVVAAVKLDDLVAFRKATRQPDGAHARLGATARHADFLDTRH